MKLETLILVVGCHRSGTSAVAGALRAMGIPMGDDLIGPAFDNPRGFFESRRVVAMHDRLLALAGASWDRPPQGIPSAEWHHKVGKEIAAFVRSLSGPLFPVKDPRASLFLPYWRKVCETIGIKLCVLEVRREPKHIIASLMAREGWTRKRARVLVEQYEKAIREARKNWIADWRWQVIIFPNEVESRDVWIQIAGAFDLFKGAALPEAGLDVCTRAASEFIDRRLIHHGKRNGAGPLWTAIIPSCSDDKLLDCVASLVEAHPDIEPDQIVVVDDGLSFRTRFKLRGVRWVQGKRPFVFAEAINRGVAAAHPDSDIVILGDDVRFETPRALDRLAASCNGAAAVAPAVRGVCGQEFQCAGATITSYQAEVSWLAFICTYIPRPVWDQVGQLDERFVGYGYDDVDWCRRARTGWPLIVDHRVRVLHLEDSTWRSRDDWRARYEENRLRYEEKWRAQT